MFTDIANSTFKPPGAGPFPAVVLMHSCGGVKNPHIKQHAQEILQQGYVVLVVDSFGPRGFENCAARVLSGSAGVADAYAALASLSVKPFVDKSRIYQVGYSWGAIIATMLASPQSATVVGSSSRFTATVSNYSSCSFENKYQLLLRDSDRPVLMLLGELDQELPPASCFPLLNEIGTSFQVPLTLGTSRAFRHAAMRTTSRSRRRRHRECSPFFPNSASVGGA